MPISTRLLFTALLCMGPAATLCAAQALPAGLKACSSLHDDKERLACYDREVARLNAGTAATTRPASTAAPVAATAGATATAAASAGPTPEQRFGLSQEKIETRYEPAPGTASLEELHAVVVRSTPQGQGNFLIELDNGQQWWQIDTDKNLRLKPGSEVTIKRGAIGSYMLSYAGRGVHVKRLL